jgi:hypothetical protein
MSAISAVLFCTWGARGATALDATTGELLDYTNYSHSDQTDCDQFPDSQIVEYAFSFLKFSLSV